MYMCILKLFNEVLVMFTRIRSLFASFMAVVSLFVSGCSQTYEVVPSSDNSSEAILSQNIAAFSFLRMSIISDCRNNDFFDNLSVYSSRYDEAISSRYPVAFSYPSINQTRSSNDTMFDFIPSEYLQILRNTLYDFDGEEPKGYEKSVSYIMATDWFESLNSGQQKDVINFCTSLALCRDAIIDTSMKIINDQVTRSPADARVWSDVAKQLDEDDRNMVVDATFYGMGLVASPTSAAIVGAIAMIWSWVRG